MPQAAEDLAEDMIFRFLDEEDWLQELQRRMIREASSVQKLPKAALTPSVAAARRRMTKLNQDTLDYYRTNFDKIFLAGARKIDPTYVISAADRRLLALANTNEYLSLRDAQQSVVHDTKRFVDMVWNDRADRRKALGTRYHRVNIIDARDKTQDFSRTTMKYRGIRAKVYRDGKKYKLGDYGSMAVRSSASRAYNLGIIQAAKKQEIKFLSVSDGPECGWSFHQDTDQANGKIVTLDEAAAFPLAHPNCRRTFAPATDKEQRDEAKRRAAQRKQTLNVSSKVAKTAIVAVGATLAAAEATNLAYAGAERLATSASFAKVLERLTVRGLQGDVRAQWLTSQMNHYQNFFLSDQSPLAPVIPLYPGAPIAPTSLPFYQRVSNYAEEFLTNHDPTKIPDYIKKVLGAADETINENLGERFQAFYEVAKRAVMSEDVGDNVRNVIDMEARRRGLFQATLSRLPGAPEINGAWSRWGPRGRIDVTSWVRTSATYTKTGLISAVKLNPAGQVRGVFKMYQDGLIGGHISALPKKFLNGVVRAIVEIDENGALVGNLRLVPKGPLRLRMEFITEEARTDLRDILAQPLGALGDIGERFRSFKFNRAVLELRVFNQSVFDISANLRIPVAELRQYIAEAVGKRDLQAVLSEGYPVQRYTGTFSYISRNPNFVKKIFQESKATLFGNVRFSSLTAQATENNAALRALKAANVRFLNRAKFQDLKLSAIVANMRIHGWNIYDIGNVLQIRYQDVQVLARNGLARVQRFGQDIGALNPEDILPIWRGRTEKARAVVRRARSFESDNPTTEDAIGEALKPFLMYPGQYRPYMVRALRELANIAPGDTEERVFNKLRNMLGFIRTQEWVEGNYLLGYADYVDDTMIRATARELVSRYTGIVKRVK